MSTAHIEQFHARASQDQALINKMLEGTDGPEGFVANAVKEAKAMGYSFTAEEASVWIKKQQDIKASGELSDSQLEAVAGGKGAKKTFNNAANWVSGAQLAAGDWGRGAMITSSNWFSSW